jgi:hypothetical protein
MNVEIRWENEERTVIRYTYSGDWNWEQFYTVLETRLQEDKLDSRATVLVDFRGITKFPSDMILHLKRAAALAGETQVLVVVIANSASLITLYNLFVRVYSQIGKRFRLVRNDEEAYALLKLPYNP